MKVNKLNTNQVRGDTIVEVLICIAIVGAVILGAYSLASHSLQEGISASEHTEAQKLAEGQVEALIFRQQNSSDKLWTTRFAPPDAQDVHYCLDTTSTGPGDGKWMPNSNGATPDVLTPPPPPPPPGNYNPACLSPDATNAKYYYLDISIPNCPSRNCTDPTFLITVRWVSIGGGVQAKSQYYYRF